MANIFWHTNHSQGDLSFPTDKESRDVADFLDGLGFRVYTDLPYKDDD
jgi:hypothetical protein